MKRAPALHGLSADHHRGLVLARRARRAAAGEGPRSAGEAWAETAEKFRAELEPHFQIEEAFLVPALEAAGASALARRLLDEHRDLRELMVAAPRRTPALLARFGETLEQHIRFEEREVFEFAQGAFDPAQLARIAAAHRARTRADPR